MDEIDIFLLKMTKTEKVQIIVFPIFMKVGCTQSGVYNTGLRGGSDLRRVKTKIINIYFCNPVLLLQASDFKSGSNFGLGVEEIKNVTFKAATQVQGENVPLLMHCNA